jgi:NAD(P)-dependent dehydrogenase (short-subunit alcohol dehydrogenase family)
VSTGGAHQGFDGMLSYCASKAALRSVYESLRDEYAGRICFGSAQPGVVATEMMRGLVRRRCGTCFHMSSGRRRHSLVDPRHRSRTRTTPSRSVRISRVWPTRRRTPSRGDRHQLRASTRRRTWPASSRSSSWRRATTSSGRRTGTLGMRRTTAGGRHDPLLSSRARGALVLQVRKLY